MKVKALESIIPEEFVASPLSCITMARDRVAVVMEQGVECHSMTKFQGS